MTEHTGQGNVSERHLVGPELVPRLRGDDSQLAKSLIRTHSSTDQQPDQCALSDRAGGDQTIGGGQPSDGCIMMNMLVHRQRDEHIAVE